MSLEQDIDNYVRQVVLPAINEKPYLAKYIFRGIREDFEEPAASMIIGKVKEVHGVMEELTGES